MIEWERLARAETHWIRIAVLELLGLDDGRVLSPNELRLELQMSVSNVGYHVTELAKAGMLELVDTAQRRGAVEHYYRVVA